MDLEDMMDELVESSDETGEVEEPGEIFEEEAGEPEEVELEEQETEPEEEEPIEAKRGKEEKLDASFEEIAKFGAMKGRLVDLLVIIIAIVMIVFFISNDLWKNPNKVSSIAMGMLLNIALIGLTVIVLLYVAASSQIAKGDALARLDTAAGYRAAIEKYNKALNIDRRSKKAWTCKGLALRMVSHDKGNLMESLRCHNRALKIDPKYAVAWVNKGNVLFNLGETDEAIKSYDKAIELDPNYTVAWVNKGEMLVKLGERKEAQKCLDRAQALVE
jgi:tetratricopeptide (TPR) repeat protein